MKIKIKINIRQHAIALITPKALYSHGSGRWLAWTNNTATHYAAIHCQRQQQLATGHFLNPHPTRPAWLQLADIPLSHTIGLHPVIHKLKISLIISVPLRHLGLFLLFCLSLFFILYVSVSVCLCLLLPNYSLVNKDWYNIELTRTHHHTFLHSVPSLQIHSIEDWNNDRFDKAVAKNMDSDPQNLINKLFTNFSAI